MREAIRGAFHQQEDMEVVAEACDGEEALRVCSQLKPDVVILDIVMPKMSGVEATREIVKACPETSVLILTAYDDDRYVVGLLEAGAAGYLLKTARGHAIVNYVSTAVFGLGRHALDRLFYVLLIAYAGWFLGVRWGVITLALALAAMIPRAVWLSPLPRDAVFETFTAVVTGGLILTLAYTIRRGRSDREALVSAMSLLKESEAEYRELFENASDAIWIHDLDGKIVQANKATEKLNGYTLAEMIGKDVRSFLSEDGHTLAREVKEKLLGGEPVWPRYEQHLYRKDGSEAIVELTTRLITRGAGRWLFKT